MIFSRILILSSLIFLFGCSKKSQTTKSSVQVKSPIRYELNNDFSNSENFTFLDTAISRFNRSWDIKGSSVAIMRYGKLVYAKGFGYANVEDGEKMQPYHILRVASVSKLITAVAVMRLVEEGKISLNSKIFGPEGILNYSPFDTYVDSRVEEVTVKQLMNHSAGWTTRWGDHLFIPEDIARALGKELPVTRTDIIRFALSKRMHFNPGTRSSYINLGYLILEEVIERVTHRDYESFVRGAVLNPIGVDDAYLAFNYDSLRLPHEVRYYEVSDAEHTVSFDGKIKKIQKSRGGNDIRTLGAAGGWVISAASLAKLVDAIDIESKSKILTYESITELTNTEPDIHPLGWRSILPDGSKWRTGSFSGTFADILVRPDGITFVFLSNTSVWVGPKIPVEVNRLMDRGIQRVIKWPDVDLFQYHTSFPNNYVVWVNYPRNKKFWMDETNSLWFTNEV